MVDINALAKQLSKEQLSKEQYEFFEATKDLVRQSMEDQYAFFQAQMNAVENFREMSKKNHFTPEIIMPPKPQRPQINITIIVNNHPTEERK